MGQDTQIFLAAVANEHAQDHLQKTVLEGVPQDLYEQYTNGDFGNPTPLWGISSGNWKKYGDKFRSGDVILFYSGENSDTGIREYSYMATITMTETNPELSEAIWTAYSGTLRRDNSSRPWPYILYLADVERVHIRSRELHDDLGYKDDFLMDFRRAKPKDVEQLTADYENVREYLEEKYWSSQSEPHSEETDESDARSRRARVDQEEGVSDLRPPRRVESAVSRIVRNTTIVKRLKKKYDYRCQVCSEQRRRKLDAKYAEGHHLHPLGNSPAGPDHEQNLLVLCPNHHADFDYGMIKVDPETLEMTHAYDEGISGGKLWIHDDHQVKDEFLEYHNENIANF
ncbi:HNH endonuclease [Haladaptatus sp. CMAA 1911]|uniref:HNH endonuclease n=1 Tax=unclassified Haladaptatus TaxID=2622732 RepID=UPI0037553070